MSVRLFVGNLDIIVEEKHLEKKFSAYGDITACAVKEKKDIDGNVISRFAYISYDADANRVADCIRDLDGTSWKGSNIKVSIAKESFLDRLKREREGKEAPNHYEPPPKKSFSKFIEHEKPNNYKEENYSSERAKQHNYEELFESSNVESYENPGSENTGKSFEFHDHSNPSNDYYQTHENGYENSQSWEENSRNKKSWSGASNIPTPSMVRYDPLSSKKTSVEKRKPTAKKSKEEKFKPSVQISANIFSGESEKFSLSDQFHQASNDEEDSEEPEKEAVEVPLEIQPPILSNNFFNIVIHNMEELESWMAPKEDRSKQFDAIRATLLNTASTHAANARTKKENLEKLKNNTSWNKKSQPKHKRNFGNKFKK